MSTHGATPVQKFQIIAVSVVGVIAGVCFLVSLLVAGSDGSMWRTFALIAAVACAVIGASFLLTARLR